MGSTKTTTQQTVAAPQTRLDSFLSGTDNYAEINSIDNQIRDLEQRQSNIGTHGDLRPQIDELRKRKESLQRSQSTGALQTQYQGLSDLVNSGPGQQDVTAGLESNRSLAEMLRQYAQEGGNLPTAGDISSSNRITDQLFQAQQLGLQQAFQDQSVEANRRAALQGRSLNDPMLAAKLAIEQTRQQNMFGAQKGAFATNFALQQPGQRLGFMTQRNDLMSGLASQAMSNRQALLGIGSSLQANERNWRNSQGVTTGTQTESPGALGIMSGILSAGGAAFGIGKSFLGGGTPSVPSVGAGGLGPNGGSIFGDQFSFQSQPQPSMFGNQFSYGNKVK